MSTRLTIKFEYEGKKYCFKPRFLSPANWKENLKCNNDCLIESYGDFWALEMMTEDYIFELLFKPLTFDRYYTRKIPFVIVYPHDGDHQLEDIDCTLDIDFV